MTTKFSVPVYLLHLLFFLVFTFCLFAMLVRSDEKRDLIAYHSIQQ